MKNCKTNKVDPMPLPSYPQSGDAVLLTGHWDIVKPGAIGILGGACHQKCEDFSITFNPSSFRGNGYVSCSGGPATMWTPSEEFTFSGRQASILFWRWRDGVAGADRGVYYRMVVPIWLWRGTRELTKDDLEQIEHPDDVLKKYSAYRPETVYRVQNVS